MKQDLLTIDWDLCIQLAGGSAEIAQELLLLFAKQLPEEHETINAHFNAGEWQEACRALHKFRGGLCYCGLPRLNAISQTLELAIKANPQDEANKALLDAFNQAAADFQTDFSALPWSSN